MNSKHRKPMSPYNESELIGLKFKNEKGMPIKVGAMASSFEIVTNGGVLENKGANIKIVRR